MNFSDIKLDLREMSPYIPVLTGHSQTLLGHLVPSPRLNAVVQPQVLTLPDGDELYIEYVDNKSNTTVSLFHGLGGSSAADYIGRTARIAGKMGWNIILVNHRAASVKAKATKTYHSGRGEDAGAVMEWARKKFSGTKLVGVGFSMSGSILLNLLSGRYGESKPDYAVIVNAPLDLKKAAVRLTYGMSKIYDYRFYLILKKIILEKDNIKLPPIGRTLDIDDIYTSKKNGFVNGDDYYEKCSVLNYVDRVKTKTFVLSSYDDPFIDVNDYLNAKWGPDVHLTLQKFGGHMGYFNKKTHPQYGRRWLDHYLRTVFEKIGTF